MSLIKLATRLRAHDWTAAMIDLLIVVVGILVALQVSNWNHDRLERARGDSYYRRVHDNLVTDRHAMDSALAFWKQVSDYGRGAMTFAETGQRVDGSSWKTVLAYYQASQIMPFELEDTSFLEMRDTGDLALGGAAGQLSHRRHAVADPALLGGDAQGVGDRDCRVAREGGGTCP